MTPARPVTVCLALLLLASGAASAADSDPDLFHKHVVVSQESHASDIGRDILRQGGNAVDAAVATAFALAVTHPAAGNLGGGGFLVAYDAEHAAVRTFDFRETAPAASTPAMYLGPDGKLLPRHRAGARAAGVPGTVRGLGLAHATLGKKPWADLVRPAVTLAKDGFIVNDALARSLNAQLAPRKLVPPSEPAKPGTPAGLQSRRDDLGPGGERLVDFPETVAAFQKPNATPGRAGDRLTQPDLARTLDRIATAGPDEFYRGETAKLLADYCASHDGLITLADLAAYQAKERPPIHTTYRGHDVYGMGPSASGGIALAQMLGILETFDLKSDGPQSPRTLHRITEAQRRAYFTRATQIADPDFEKIPVADLISLATIKRLASTITDKATPSASLAPFPVIGAEGADTTHLSTYDASGNAVALTYTLEEGYGSKAVVAGAGFLLNNEMGDFNIIPGRTDARGQIGTEPNRIAPGKRMLSSQCPTIVLKDGKVRLVTGSPGGRTIPNTVLWVVLNVLEFHLDPRAAVDAPRTHHAWFPDVITLEGSSWPAASLDALKSQGHKLRTIDIQGDAHTIVVDPAKGLIHGVADKRRITEKASGD